MKVSSIRWGVIWIGVGFLFLAINFGVLDKLVFPALFSLWPILLIAIGVELIFRKTKFYFLALLSPLLIAAAFIIAAVYAGGYSWSFNEFWKDWSWNYEGEKRFSEGISFDPGVDTVRIDMDLGESDFNLQPSSEAEFSVDANYYRVSPIITTRKEGTTIYLQYRNRENGNRSIFSLATGGLYNKITIFNQIWLYADIETREKYPEFDFSDFKLKTLLLSLKAREAKISFGDNIGNARIEMTGRSERLILTLPSDLGLELLMDDPDIKNLNNIDGFYRFQSGLRTDNFESSNRKATVALNLTTRKIDLRRI